MPLARDRKQPIIGGCAVLAQRMLLQAVSSAKTKYKKLSPDLTRRNKIIVNKCSNSTPYPDLMGLALDMSEYLRLEINKFTELVKD